MTTDARMIRFIPFPSECIERMPVLSTAHISKKESENLPGPLAGASWEYGWFLYVADLDKRDCPAANWPGVANIMEAARRWGVDWVRLDCDGPVCEGLPTFDW